MSESAAVGGVGASGAGSKPAPLIAYPSWMDSRYMLAACKATQPVELVAGSDGTFVIPGNPQRWGLLIQSSSSSSGQSWSPFADAQNWPALLLAGSGASRLLTIFEWGPLVAYQWNGVAILGERARYSELITF